MPMSAKAILYIEDDAGLARLLKKRLERSEYLVDTACDGAGGLALLGDKSYAAVLIDYELPDLSGLEVLRLLGGSHGPPVIMLTGNGNEKIAVQAMKLGAADYLVKDVDLRYLELLPMVIAQVLQRRRLLEEREEIEKQVSESEERYRKLVELCPDGISIHFEGRLEFINTAGAKMLGATSGAELLGRSMLDLVHPDFHDVFLKQQEGLGREGEEVPWVPHKFRCCDGGVLNVEVAALPITLEGRNGFQTVFRDISERKAAEERLQRMANYDLLTGLPNRTLFFDRLSRLILHARRDPIRFALLFIDLDRFKEANDRFGHGFGDGLLKEVARRLNSCLRETDTAARMGGDEFVLISTGIASRGDAVAVARRVSENLARPYLVRGQEFSLGASIGISLFPEDGETVELQLVKADTAMYRCKRRGANGYHFYSGDPSAIERITRSGLLGAGEPEEADVSRTVA